MASQLLYFVTALMLRRVRSVQCEIHSSLVLPRWNGQYEGVSKSLRIGCLERELQMVQLSATRCSCVAILCVSLSNFTAIILCVASQRVFVVISLSTQSGNFWIHPRILSSKWQIEKAVISYNDILN
jgi:hypothetical protein